MSEKLKAIIQQYGKLALYTHISLSLMFYGGFYFLIHNKFIDPMKYLEKLGIKPSSSSIVNATCDAAMAYVLYKATMPIRISITVVTIPLVVKLIRRK